VPIYFKVTMITFPCPCGTHSFSLPDDEAGALVQCPNCKRLNDVPTLSDLAAMEQDGTVKFAPEKPKSERNRLAELQRSFGRSRKDANGNEIDLRQTFDQLRSLGEKPIELADAAPKYDPLTGELIRPIDIRPTAPRPVIAIAQVAAPAPRNPSTLNYAKRPGAGRTHTVQIPSLASLPFRLLEPINLIVMFFVTVLLVIMSSMAMPIIGGFFLIAPIPVFIYGFMLAHYANCIDDLGPGEEDELPTPLRFAGFLEDIWWPFTRMFFSLMLCFGPAILVPFWTHGAPQFVASGVLLFAGVMLFPAVAMTLCATGHPGNLRPDRMLSLIAMLGPAYVPAVVIAFVAVLANLTAVGLFSRALMFGLATANFRAVGTFAGAGLLSAMLAVYMGHLAAWWLAVLYRRHQSQLPWHFEEHERDRSEHKRLSTLAEIERARHRRFHAA
jgi:hypothetical protein